MAKSLAEQANVLDAPFKLPAVFQEPQEPIKSWAVVPYITFAHQKRQEEWNKLKNAFDDVEEGGMYLIQQNSQHKLNPAKLTMMCCKQFWSETNAAGDVQRVSFKEKPRPYKENIEAVVLVYLDTEIVPANISFRTTKCPAAKTLYDALMEASNPSWGEKSPKHMESMVCSQPFMRFYGIMSLGVQRVSKLSGLPYRTTTCSVNPTGMAEWRMLKNFCDSPDSEQKLEETAARFTRRIDEIKMKA